MSPATKSKSKDKSAKVVKEQQQKASKLLIVPTNGGSSIPASAYNPVSGTFHSLETVSSVSSPVTQTNGRFRTIDETEDHSGSLNGSAEYDSVSNNDSCSGESEDQKEKSLTSTAARLEAIPGSDTDKRDKIRQKNERKHQRQRERRAQELHERCSGYLMSRKLESLSQQLVTMGFPAERATMALILNEGRVEESVAWLFEGGEGGEQLNLTNLEAGGNLKIDISDELAKIAELEVRFKCSKQEVERAAVACEGDMEKAAETLKAQYQEPHVPLKVEESREFAVVNGGNRVAVPTQIPITRTQVKTVVPVIVQPHRKDERDSSYSKQVVPGAVSLESGNKNLQSLRRLQAKQEWPRPQVAEKRWPTPSSSPSVSYSLASSPLQIGVQPVKTDSRYPMVGTESKTNLQMGGLREQVIVMQRPQSINAKQNLPSAFVGVNASLPVSTGWHQNGVANLDMMKVADGGLAQSLQNVSLSSSNPSPSLQYHRNHYQRFASSSMDTVAAGWDGMWNSTVPPCAGALSSIAAPSSLGLFTGWGSSGSSGSSSPVDWSTAGSMIQCDYNSIDWSLDSTPSPLRLKLGSSLQSDRPYDTWTSNFGGANILRPGMNGGACIAGLQEGGLAIDQAHSGGSHEWTSPFAGKDLFRVPRQSVTSPSL